MKDLYWTHNLLLWFDNNSRDLYWRKNNLNDFQWLMLEILLRRSKAEMVSKISRCFFSKYKNPQDILMASCNELSDDLKRLGYHNKRAIILKDVAKDVNDRFKGTVPLDFQELYSIKHIGVYITSAFLCFKIGRDEPCVDTNVLRIIGRIYGINVYGDNRIDTIIGKIIKEIAPYNRFRDFNYALLDLGGTICKVYNPICTCCPVNQKCYHFLK